MRVATANIRNNPDMPRPKVVADARTVAPHADVILFQEIGEAEDHADIVTGLGEGWTVEHFGNAATPIAYRTGSLKVVARGREIFHKGLAGVSPVRGVTWIETADGTVYMNTHFVSGAWNAKKNKAKEWRKARWREHHAKMKTLVREMRAAGKTVVLGGDFNRQKVGKFHRSQVWLFNAERGIDKIAVVPAKGATYKVHGRVKVLDLNSDHHARIVDVEVRPAPSFRAATWNVFYGTPVKDLRPILRRLHRDGVSLILFQEISNPEVRKMIKEEGWRLYFHPRQYGIAFRPEVWKGLGGEGLRLAAQHYYAKGGKTPNYSDAVRGLLKHRESGKTLDVLSYHTPAHVQPDLGTSVPRRLEALRQSMATLKALAAQNRADAVLYGGDDNVDEKKGNGSKSGFWRFMLKPATGLRQVQAPSPTHGHKERGRRIDDFRVRGLRVGDGEVRPGGGDHRVHVRRFTF